MKMKKILVTVCSVLLCFGAFYDADAAEYPKMRIRAATANPDGSLHVEAINKFKEIVEKESGGKITVQTFYGGSMGDEQANVKQLRTAEIHLTVVSNGNLTPFAASAGVFYLPYGFPTPQDAEKVLNNKPFMDKMANQIAKESGARPLSWLMGGYRILTNSKRPIKTLQDLQGLKMRVPAVEIQLDTFRAWGVEASPLAWSETFNGLQQGVIDGQENPHTINRDQKFWEVQKYITNMNYLLWVGPMLVSDRWYQKLDADTKALIDKACYEAARYEWKWAAEQEQIALQQCIERGMVVDTLEDEQKWIDAARQVWPKYYDKIGGQANVDEMLKIMAQ